MARKAKVDIPSILLMRDVLNHINGKTQKQLQAILDDFRLGNPSPNHSELWVQWSTTMLSRYPKLKINRDDSTHVYGSGVTSEMYELGLILLSLRDTHNNFQRKLEINVELDADTITFGMPEERAAYAADWQKRYKAYCNEVTPASHGISHASAVEQAIRKFPQQNTFTFTNPALKPSDYDLILPRIMALSDEFGCSQSTAAREFMLRMAFLFTKRETDDIPTVALLEETLMSLRKSFEHERKWWEHIRDESKMYDGNLSRVYGTDLRRHIGVILRERREKKERGSSSGVGDW